MLEVLKRCHKLLLIIAIPLLVSPIFLWEGYKREAKDGNVKNSHDLISYKQPHGFFVIMVMTLYWVTECIPLACTSFVPLILFPLFGILNSDAVTSEFLKDTILFLLGGCIIALSFEYCNLHTRIALRVILSIGARIPNLLMGIMATAMFLSCWMNNTSCTSMMIPLVNVIMDELKKITESESVMLSDNHSVNIGETHNSNNLEMTTQSTENTTENMEAINSYIEIHKEDTNEYNSKLHRNDQVRDDNDFDEDKHEGKTSIEVSGKDKEPYVLKRNRRTETDEVRKIKIMFLLATAYAANIGGTGVIQGTGTNLIAVAALDLKREEVKEKENLYQDPSGCLQGKYLQITFIDWMYFAVIPMIINTLVCWLYLQIHFIGFPVYLYFWRKKTREEQTKASIEAIAAKNIEVAIRKKYDELGAINFDEIAVLVIFLITVALWVFRDPIVVPGWGSLFQKGLLRDATPTLLMSCVLFVIPRNIKYYKTFFQGGFQEGMKDTLMTWTFVVKKLPWGPFILLGGGSTMAAGSHASGLNEVINDFLSESEFIKTAEPWVILMIVLSIIAVLTSVASNTATAAIVSPVLISLAISKSVHPLYLLMPPTIASSYAFALPVSTPPNAIVFDQSDMKQMEMMKPGIIATILCNIMLFACTHTILEVLFRFQLYSGTCDMYPMSPTLPV